MPVEGPRFDPTGNAGAVSGDREVFIGVWAQVKRWTTTQIADALAKRRGKTSLKVNGSQIGEATHLDVQMSGATGEYSSASDTVRAILPAGSSGLPRCSAYGGRSPFAGPAVSVIDLTTADFDPDTWFDASANTIVLPEDGDYFAHGTIAWFPEVGTDPTSGSYRSLELNCILSGSGSVGQRIAQASPPWTTFTSYGSGFTQDVILHKTLPAFTRVSISVAHDATGPMGVLGPSDGWPGLVARLSVVKLS